MILPNRMNCIEISIPGGPEALKFTSRPTPRCRKGEVIIKVAAAGVNRPDCIQRSGNYPPPPGVTDIPGLEVSGTVVSIGEKTKNLKLGDTVAALVSGGGYSEYVAAPATQCLPIPKNLDFIQAAALPETFFTVWANLFDNKVVRKGDSLLIHGGSSGIGTTAIQIATSLGIRVLTTAGTEKKCLACKKLGAEIAINYHNEDFVVAVKKFNARGVNAILDMVGGEYINRNIRALAPEGHLINIAFLQGSKTEIDLMPMMLKRLTITGSTLRPQSEKRKEKIGKSLQKMIWPLIEEEKILPVIYKTFPLEDAKLAHTLMESSQHIGKIMLKI